MFTGVMKNYMEIKQDGEIAKLNSFIAFRQSDSKEAYDPEQGKRIIHPQAITGNMANQFFGVFWGRQDVFVKRSDCHR